MSRKVAIDCLAESYNSYSKKTALVVVDVIRSTTVAASAVKSGRECFFAPTVEAALILARGLDEPLLVGEVGGNMPYGFDYKNSPVIVEKLPKNSNPIILVSSSGIPLLYSLSRHNEAVFCACLRNYSATINTLAKTYSHVYVFGAPTRGEFREEDKLCCSLIADGLLKKGFVCNDEKTAQIVNCWKDKPVSICAEGKSAKYLRETSQTDDLNFILEHVDDFDQTLIIRGDEIKLYQ